jgi:hypothetical protein
MSDIFKKDGHYFRACIYCGQDILIHSLSGNAYSMVVHNDNRTEALCFECAKAIGAARSHGDYDYRFTTNGKFFVQYSDYWISWRGPSPSYDDEMPNYGIFNPVSRSPLAAD